MHISTVLMLSVAQETAESSSPWWQVPLVAGLFTVIAALTGLVGVLLQERNKSRREDTQRWDVERSKLYAEFLEGLQELYMMATHQSQPSDQLDASMRRISYLAARIRLLAPARELVQLVVQLEKEGALVADLLWRYERDDEDVDTDRFEATVMAMDTPYWRLYRQFLAESRNSLGMPVFDFEGTAATPKEVVARRFAWRHRLRLQEDQH